MYKWAPMFTDSISAANSNSFYEDAISGVHNPGVITDRLSFSENHYSPVSL